MCRSYTYDTAQSTVQSPNAQLLACGVDCLLQECLPTASGSYIRGAAANLLPAQALKSSRLRSREVHLAEGRRQVAKAERVQFVALGRRHVAEGHKPTRAVVSAHRSAVGQALQHAGVPSVPAPALCSRPRIRRPPRAPRRGRRGSADPSSACSRTAHPPRPSRKKGGIGYSSQLSVLLSISRSTPATVHGPSQPWEMPGLMPSLLSRPPW